MSYISINISLNQYTYTMPEQSTRAQNLRKRAKIMAVVHNFYLSDIAKAIGYSREYMYNVLTGKYQSEVVLDKISAYLDNIENTNEAQESVVCRGSVGSLSLKDTNLRNKKSCPKSPNQVQDS